MFSMTSSYGRSDPLERSLRYRSGLSTYLLLAIALGRERSRAGGRLYLHPPLRPDRRDRAVLIRSPPPRAGRGGPPGPGGGLTSSPLAPEVFGRALIDRGL